MSNDIEIVVKSTDATAAGFAKSVAGSDAAAKKFKADQDEMTKASDNFEKIFKTNLQDGESASEALQRVVGNTRAEVDKLRATFAQTGSGHDFMGLKNAEADLAVAESYLQDMVGKAPKQGREVSKNLGDGMFANMPLIGGFVDSVSKKLGGLVSDALKVGEQAGTDLGEGMTSATGAAAQDIPQLFTPEGAIGAAIVATIVGGLAAVIGGAIATALTVGVGVGFIGIGAMILKNNAQVLSSFMQLKTDVGQILSTAAQPLIEPFQKALATIDAMFAREGPALQQVFAAVAPAVTLIANGISAFLSELIPKLAGVGHVFSAMFADPGVQAQLHLLGLAIANVFDEITSHPQDVADFFALLVGAINAVVITVNLLVAAWTVLLDVWRASPLGSLVDGVTRLVGAIDGGSGKVSKFGVASAAAAASVDALNTSVKDVAETSDESGPTLDDLAAQLKHADVTAQTLAGTLTDKLLGSIMDNQTATLHFDESLTNLTTTLKTNKDALDIHKAAGQADREAVLASVSANIKQYDAMIAAGASAVTAAHQYDVNTAALERTLRKAGLTKAQIDGLIGSYKKVPDKVNSEIAMKGLTDAINNLDNLLRLLNHLPPLTTPVVDIKINGASQLNKVYDQLTHGGGPNRSIPKSSPSPYTPKGMGHPGSAHGGIASGLTYLAEQGRELLGNLPPGTMVHSNPDTERILAAGGGRGGPMRVELVVGAGANSAIGTMIQNLVRLGQIQLKVVGTRVTV